MKRIKKLLFILLTALFLSQTAAHAQDGLSTIMTMTIDGAIAPASQQYLERAVNVAERQNAEMLILQLNTPGGSIDTMNEMLQIIRGSHIPIIVYVSPKGAMAGSAGTIITLAGHASAMAPETIIGAASPINSDGTDIDDTAKAKATEALKATVRALAERRGTEAIALAEATIEEARAVSAKEAFEVGLVDFIANDLGDLLTQLNGYEITINNETRILNTNNARVEDIPLTLIEQLLKMLTDPNIVFLLIAIGTQAIFIELGSPGGWVAGFIGVVALALATYGMGVLPVNYFGIIFIIISFVLFILDVKAPTHGALTAAGIGSFIVGALVLFNSAGTPEFARVSIPLVITVALLIAAMFTAILGFALRALKAPIRTGHESMVGKTGFVKADFAPDGMVRVGSELWSAEKVDLTEAISKGERVEVVEVEGLRLKVKKLDD
ncbi:MAG: nodulation protein NfeD [Anaerolineae bacterium]|jgi:membrane-bound serine protease (ClpP class)|nr:nodulation protein NfeD [Anaerolineae bacterium]MBT4311742.1 nodulation protein NfeD [Anaerolineae bacterium]MBT4458554.1 nodulation protein NfeD [Anaerolineae bacterium]MBT4840854.1 nodulation protein NfeD [Anaerolineae bacterium]MBT6062003.1 nodulation protein NfeD [Anaerolineae bacterium]